MTDIKWRLSGWGVNSMKPGVLVISHGSREADWVALVDDAVREVRLPEGIPVVSSFLEIVDGRLIQDGIDRLSAGGVTDIYVLPLFVSSGSTHVDDIGQAFGLKPVSGARAGELEPFDLRGTSVAFGRPIDDDPDIAALLLDNIRELSSAPDREALVLVAHGSGEAVFHERWRTGMRKLAERVRELGGFARAETAMLLPDEAASVLKAMQRQAPDEAIIVVPLFLSDGYFTRHVIPGRLEGLSYRYNGRSILPNAFAARWMERQIYQWLEQLKCVF
ncbi:sirohydrochlorin chelatase [Paenibacillus tarimensis]